MLCDWKILPSSTESVYTTSQMNPNFSYEAFTHDASKLFRQSSRFVSPKELNYELPSNNVPEFAFVGRYKLDAFFSSYEAFLISCYVR